MTDAFAVEAHSTAVTVGGDSPSAVVTADITSRLDQHARVGVQVRPVEPLEAGWVTVEPDTFPLEPGNGRQVSARVEPPADAPAGEYRFALRAYDTDRPADAFTESVTITVTVVEREETGPPGWLLPALAVAVLVVVGVAVWLLVRGGDDNGTVPIRVPDLTGMTLGEAEQALAAVDLVLGGQRTQSSDEHAEGQVITQEPLPTRELAPGLPVDVVVSTGPAEVPVPRLRGRPVEDAAQALEELGLDVARVESEFSNLANGTVIRSEPSAGTRLRPGSGVVLFTSRGPRPVAVPDVEGLRQGEACQRVQQRGLVCEVVSAPLPTPILRGRVLRQLPEGGTRVDPGSTVRVFVPR